MSLDSVSSPVADATIPAHTLPIITREAPLALHVPHLAAPSHFSQDEFWQPIPLHRWLSIERNHHFRGWLIPRLVGRDLTVIQHRLSWYIVIVFTVSFLLFNSDRFQAMVTNQNNGMINGPESTFGWCIDVFGRRGCTGVLIFSSFIECLLPLCYFGVWACFYHIMARSCTAVLSAIDMSSKFPKHAVKSLGVYILKKTVANAKAIYFLVIPFVAGFTILVTIYAFLYAQLLIQTHGLYPPINNFFIPLGPMVGNAAFYAITIYLTRMQYTLQKKVFGRPPTVHQPQHAPPQALQYTPQQQPPQQSQQQVSTIFICSPYNRKSQEYSSK